MSKLDKILCAVTFGLAIVICWAALIVLLASGVAL
jgi:hypothetical protein